MIATITPTITIDHLRQQQGERVLLDLPSLTLTGPGCIALTGDNGAGKTTLLRLLCGRLEVPDHGTIDHTVPVEQRLLVDQSPYLFSTHVAGNVAYGLKVRGVARGPREQRVAEALQMVGMSDYAHRPAASLSVGEARRVAIARGLAVEPQLLLLDEPDAGLDEDARQMLQTVLRSLAQDRLIIYATHRRDGLRQVADRIVTLSDGRLVE